MHCSIRCIFLCHKNKIKVVIFGICSPSATRYALNYDEFGNTSEIYVEQRQLVEN